MASQQTRSAFKLTSIAATNSVLNSITRLIIRLQMHSGTLFWVCVLFGIRSTISYSSDAEETIVLPKFGDRISPRTRTFIEVEKLRTATTTNNNNSNNKFSIDINSMSNSPNYSADNHSYNSVNSNNSNKTEHGFNLNEANASASAIDSHSGTNSVVSVSYSEHSTNGGPSRQSKHPQHQHSVQPPSSPLSLLTSSTTTAAAANNRNKLAASLQYTNNVYNSNDNVDSVEFDVIDSENDIYNALLRQHKSLNVGANADAYSGDPSVENILCNNKNGEPCSSVGGSGSGSGGDGGSNSDNELSNEIDLRNGNSSSAQAHRLEMSTEFFVVPSTSSSSTIPSSHHLPGGIYLINIHTSTTFITFKILNTR